MRAYMGAGLRIIRFYNISDKVKVLSNRSWWIDKANSILYFEFFFNPLESLSNPTIAYFPKPCYWCGVCISFYDSTIHRASIKRYSSDYKLDIAGNLSNKNEEFAYKISGIIKL